MTKLSTPTMSRSHLKLSLISDFELSCGDSPVTMSPSAQRLVGLVALHNRPVRRSRVTGTLWLDSSSDRANASLRSALWRVPTPSGIRILSASNTHLSLNPCVEVDYRAVIARAQNIFDSPDPGSTVIDVARELCSFGEDLLPGWDDDWVVMERERFRYLRLQVLDQLAEHLCDEGRYSDALQIALAAIQSEPLHETAHRLVIRVHLQQGNVAEAIERFQIYRRTLATELGATPSVAMRRLISPCFSRDTQANLVAP
jgi:DNA-binding SARP family transcriptional activator